MIVEVSGHLGLENGLVVPGKFTASTESSSAAIGQKLKETMRSFAAQKNYAN